MSLQDRLFDWSPEEVLDQPERSITPDNGAVVYEKDKVTAYFDSTGRNVAPHFATWAKVWKPDGTLTIVSLTQQATQ